MNSIEMSALARETLAGSPDLQIVEARYRAARWRARGATGSRLLPSLGVGLDGARTEEPIAGSDERLRTEFMTSSVTARWEIELWGRLPPARAPNERRRDARRF